MLTEEQLQEIKYLLRQGAGAQWSAADRAFQAIERDAQALADVRTLDGWLDADVGTRQLKFIPTNEDFCVSFLAGSPMQIVGFVRAETPDAARAKAAAWVREQKP